MSRQWFPVTKRYAYLNHAGVSPPSVQVRDAAARWLDRFLEHGVVGESAWDQEVDLVRQDIAGLLGAKPSEIAMVRSTSHGLALVAEGLSWEAGDEVVVATEMEYPSNVYPWLHLSSRGVAVRSVDTSDGTLSVEAVARAITPRTRLVSVSAVQYATGHRVDLPKLGELCEAKGVLLCVDGIQQVGSFDLPVKRSKIHFLAADSHKWMLGLVGVGFLFVDESVVDRVRPVLVGWKSTTRARDFDRAHFELRQDALKFEEGSPSYPMIAGMGAGVRMIRELGIQEIEAHISAWLSALEVAATGLGYDVSPPRGARAGILLLDHKGKSMTEIEGRAREAGVVVSLRRGKLRVAPHFYNDAADRERLLSIL